MSLLNISTAAINANAELIIISTILVGTAIALSFFFKEKLSGFNVRHNVLHSTGTVVKTVTWGEEENGVYEDGVPFYNTSVSEEEMEVANMDAIDLENENQVDAKVAVDNDYNKHAA